MDKDYDVVVAGAGPAGGQFSRDLSKQDYDVLLLERDDEYTSKKTTGGTFHQTMVEFGLNPEEVAMHETDKTILESPENEAVFYKPGWVLEEGNFKKYLAEDAESHGAEVELGANVVDVIQEDGKAEGVKYAKDGEITEVYGDIVVDATGPNAKLAKKLGVRDPDPELYGMGVEYEIDNVDMNHEDHMMLRLGNDFAPGGYSWIFHTGDNTAKVGTCFLSQKSEEPLQHYMEEFIKDDDRFDEENILIDGQIQAGKGDVGERHAGGAYIDIPDEFVSDNFMAIGDTVSSLDPVWGEGIYKCMKSGREAAIVASEALDKQETSKKQLDNYTDRWKQNVAPNRKRRQFMTELMYSLEDERYDRLVEDMAEMGPDAMRELNKGSIPTVLSLAEPGDIKPASKLSWKKISNML